jgi:uncharacterized membrane protein
MVAMKYILFSTVLCSGLVAGLMYAYSCSVNPGFRSLSDVEYLRAMQSINRSIQNPVFFLSFMGLLLLLPLSDYHLFGQQRPAFTWMMAATICYFVGVFGVTAAGNIPLNNALEAFSISGASSAELAAMRAKFQEPWNLLHMVRTIASIVAFGLTIVSLFKMKQ